MKVESSTNGKHSDLIAIANADLEQKLNRQQDRRGVSSFEPPQNETRTFKQDIWKAIYTLNLIRYGLGMALIISAALPEIIEQDWQIIRNLVHPELFLIGAILLLLSAIAFSILSRNRKLKVSILVATQLSVDVALAALLSHSTGGIESDAAVLYIAVVACGGVILTRKQAFGLASGAVILLFFEHFYSVWTHPGSADPNYALLVRYGFLLFATGLLISYLTERIRSAEQNKFVPGDEKIEDFLVREEINALNAALEKTGGCKTDAAKLLGMTFRSFRYKLTKYDIS